MKRKIIVFILMIFTFVATLSFSLKVSAASNSYYASCDGLTGDALLNQLATITKNNHRTYTSYDNIKTMNAKSDPDPNKSGNLLDFYSRISVSATWDSGNTWNREHVWPQSLSGGLYGTSGAGSDIHHIRPTISSINGSRGNKKFTDFDLITDSGAEYKYNGTLVAYQNSSYWEPLDNVKGDTARIVMYMYMHYSTEIQANKTYNKAGNLQITNIVYGGGGSDAAWDLLCYWNELDPVDEYEANRNNYCAEVTGTRNPFIDCPEFANAIWQGGESVTPDIGGSTPSNPDTPTTPETPVVPAPSGDAAVLVESVNELKVNDQIIIVSATEDYALGTTQNKNNRSQSSIEKLGNYITYESDTQVITLTEGSKSDSFGLYVGNGYLCTASSSSNYLRTETNITDNSSWSITITDTLAQVVSKGTYTRNTIMYNSGSDIFAAYASGQESIQIYKLITEDNTPEEEDKTDYLEEVKDLLEMYYNNGVYAKDTLICLTPAAKENLVKYFHANVNVLQRTTYYKNNELWMSRGDGNYSYYGTNSQGLTNAATNTPNVTPEEVKLAIPGTTMLDYYITLADLLENSAVWNKENGVYYTTDEVVLRQYLDFTAPCLLPEIFESGYYSYDKATLEVIDGSLIMKLYVVKDNENDLTNIERILSEASISVSDYTLLENATNDVLNLNNTAINSNYNLPTTVGGVNVSWSGENVEGNVLKYISPSIETTNTLTATLTIGELTEVVTINFIQKEYKENLPGEYEYKEFSSSDLAIFDEYIGYYIPFLETDLYDVEWNSEFNGVNYYTYGNTKTDYNNYLTLLEKAGFKYDMSYEYEGITWHSYQKNGNYLDIAEYESEGIYIIDIYVYVPTNYGEPDTPTTPSNPKYSTLYFNDINNRTYYSGVKQVWTNGTITLTNAGTCGDYYNPVRLYANTNVEISGKNIICIVFSCAEKTSDKYYAELLFDALSTYYENVYMSNDTVTLTLDYPTDLVEFNTIKQTRLISITVYTE